MPLGYRLAVRYGLLRNQQALGSIRPRPAPSYVRVANVNRDSEFDRIEWSPSLDRPADLRKRTFLMW